jgi:hypothetical protein
MLDLAVFVPRLKQVIAWAAYLSRNFNYQVEYQKGNYGTVFRQLNPIIEGMPLFSIEAGYTAWNKDVYELGYLKQALQQAFEQRDEQVIKEDFNPANFQKLGRILFFDIQLTTHDGAAVAESNCFVDESDVPPIDTWFYLDNNVSRQAKKALSLFGWIPKRQVIRTPKLFCWIPKQFVPMMQAAIGVEIFDSYHWLDEVNPLVHQQIVAAMSA